MKAEQTTTQVGHEPRAKQTRQAAIRFPESLPGLDGAHLWELVEHEQARPFFWLRSVDRPPLRLLVIDPRLVREDYRPKITAGEFGRVGLEAGADLLLLSVVTLDGDRQAFVNLRAPIMVNPDQMLGAQVILDDPAWPFRQPLVGGCDGGAEGTGRSHECSYSAENPDSPSS